MRQLEKFEYWRELLLVIVMMTVLILNLSLFEGLWPQGEDGGQSVHSVIVAK
jgi:hypothetical protein